MDTPDSTMEELVTAFQRAMDEQIAASKELKGAMQALSDARAKSAEADKEAADMRSKLLAKAADGRHWGYGEF